MKNIYVGIGLAIGYGVWRRSVAREAKRTEITEAPITDGTNWQGSLYQRLMGLDLVAPGAPNLNGGVNADPGKIGMANLGLNPGWNGGLLSAGGSARFDETTGTYR